MFDLKDCLCSLTADQLLEEGVLTTWYIHIDANVPLGDNMKSFAIFRRLARSYANSARKEVEGRQRYMIMRMQFIMFCGN
jgi:hypothetical protein